MTTLDQRSVPASGPGSAAFVDSVSVHEQNDMVLTSNDEAAGDLANQMRSMPVAGSHGSFVPAFSAFRTRCIDDDRAVLVDSYRLRFQVYCVERSFLNAERYPEGLELDEFDRHAVHLGTIDSTGQLVATARLVAPSIVGLPLFRHCKIFPDEVALYHPDNRIVEVSRLSMSRATRRMRSTASAADSSTQPTGWTTNRDAVAYSLYRGLYQISKQAGFTHWLVATEASLQRAVRQYGFPFRPIGPTIDYFGPVTPYVMELAAFDSVILSGKMPRLSGFLDGVEATYRDPHQVDSRRLTKQLRAHV